MGCRLETLFSDDREMYDDHEAIGTFIDPSAESRFTHKKLK